MRRHAITFLLAFALAALAGCTRTQITAWLAWREVDQAAAEAFAHEDWVQESLVRENVGSTERDTDTDTVWDVIAQCESGGNWSTNTGNGYSGGLQFMNSSWRAYGGTEFAPLAYQATRNEQVQVAERILDDVGWRAWPTCARRAGLR